MVALSGGPHGERLVRLAARIAARSGGGRLAVHATRPGCLTAAARATLAAQQQLTSLLGGSYHQLADDDTATALLTFAHAQNATQLVIGATRRSLPGHSRTATYLSELNGARLSGVHRLTDQHGLIVAKN